MTVSFFVISACLAGGLLTYRLSAFAIASIAPVLGFVGYFISGSAWTGVAAFASIQLSYVAAVALAHLFRRSPRGEPVDAVATEAARKMEHAKMPAESLSP